VLDQDVALAPIEVHHGDPGVVVVVRAALVADRVDQRAPSEKRGDPAVGSLVAVGRWLP